MKTKITKIYPNGDIEEQTLFVNNNSAKYNLITFLLLEKKLSIYNKNEFDKLDKEIIVRHTAMYEDSEGVVYMATRRDENHKPVPFDERTEMADAKRYKGLSSYLK